MRGTHTWQLPLSDVSAAALAESLLSNSQEKSTAQAAEAVALDPSLALWTACRADQHSHLALTTVTEAGEWLTAHLLEEFNEVEDSTESAVMISENQQQWTELVAWGMAATSEDSADHYFFRLIMNADEWLSSCGTVVSWQQMIAGNSCLPKWLAERLYQLRSEFSGAASSAAMTHAETVGRQWATEIPGVGRCFAGLVRKLSRLHELEGNFAKAVEREKLNSLKQFAYGAGHEINNPLANISTRAQTLLRDEQDLERRRKLATINSQAFRAHEMIADLMLFANPPRVVRQRVELVRLVLELVEEFSMGTNVRDTKLTFDASVSDLYLLVDPNQISVALRALCTNAMEAVGYGGSVDLSIGEGTTGVSPVAEIIIRDTGPGISPEVRQHIFDPFYCGREAGRGIGFGLSKCWRIVTEHGGTITVDSRPGHSTTFTVTLPVKNPKLAAAQTL